MHYLLPSFKLGEYWEVDFEVAHDIQSVRIYPKYPSSGRMSGSTITLMNADENLEYALQIGNADDVEVFDIDTSEFVSLVATLICVFGNHVL